MTKVMKCMLYVGIFLVMCLLQGCVLWFPVDVDYDVEIVLSKKRPSLRNDICFIEYPGLYDKATTYDAWGYDLYGEGIRANNLKVYVFPKCLYEAAAKNNNFDYFWDCSPDIRYPEKTNFVSFADADMTSFTNSVRICFDRLYRARKGDGGEYGYWRYGEIDGERTEIGDRAFSLFANSGCLHRSAIKEEEINCAMEHTLQALLLRERFPQLRLLKERRISLNKRMLYTHPRCPVTYLRSDTSGVRYELWTDDDRFIGSLTVCYPAYMWIMRGETGVVWAEKAVMPYFISMLCDDAEGTYRGIVTAFVLEGKCEVGKFERVK